MLEVNNIDVFYGDIQALWDVSFKINEGEVVSILGPNGAGKTTIMNTISGILRSKQGDIIFEGENLNKVKDHDRIRLGIAHVPEGRRLFPNMTVIENLELGSLTKYAKGKRQQTLEWVFSLFPRLKDRVKQLAGTLSGGEAQMLAIGRGLMSHPKLVMFDEPSLGLSPILVSQIFDIIRTINRDGVTVLLVEQNVVKSLKCSNRAYLLETGRIVLEGKGEALLEDNYIKDSYLGI